MDVATHFGCGKFVDAIAHLSRVLRQFELCLYQEKSTDIFTDEKALLELLNTCSLSWAKVQVIAPKPSCQDTAAPELQKFSQTFAKAMKSFVEFFLEELAVKLFSKSCLNPSVCALIENGAFPSAAKHVVSVGQSLARFKTRVDSAKVDAPLGNIMELARHLADVSGAKDTCPKIFEQKAWYYEKYDEVLRELVDLVAAQREKLVNAERALEEFDVRLAPIVIAIAK